MSIAIDDCVAFEWHKEILLSLPISYVINPPCLVKTGSAVESDILELVDSSWRVAGKPFSIEPIVGAVFSDFQ
jgi:hypothetical protein